MKDNVIKQNAPEILVVDDITANVQVISVMLKTRGYKVVPALGGKQALQIIRDNPPDLILLDINMPEMDGYEVCEQLKADETLKEIPVIFITGLTETADMVKGFSMGAVDYIAKPFQIEEVCARVKTHLRLRRLQVELSNSLTELQKALVDIRTLRGIIPICANCKNIRDDKGAWQEVENYVKEHSEADFSHSLCPACAQKLYPDIEYDDDDGKE
jgi:PleD family two-component response regulator